MLSPAYSVEPPPPQYSYKVFLYLHQLEGLEEFLGEQVWVDSWSWSCAAPPPATSLNRLFIQYTTVQPTIPDILSLVGYFSNPPSRHQVTDTSLALVWTED